MCVMVDEARIMNTMAKMALHLQTHESVYVSVSGGSDSDIIVHMIATYFREYLPKIHFVFCNTGLEYAATKRHIEEIQGKYDITIDTIRGESVVTAVRKYGVPIISKAYSRIVNGVQRNAGESYIRSLNSTRAEGPLGLSKNQRALAQYLIDNDIRVSDKCCDVSKKKPLHKYQRLIDADLLITGERQAEGGRRALVHKDCFEHGKNIDKYMPLFFWNDETKQWYKEHENIRYSDCYEIWGMKRTGCVGCPFNSRIGVDLDIIQEYEPNMYKACMNVFGESYRLMDKFNVRRIKILKEDDVEKTETKE